MKTKIMKIGNKLFIEIPNSIENLYQLKETSNLSMNVIEKNNSLIINSVLIKSNNNFKNFWIGHNHLKTKNYFIIVAYVKITRSSTFLLSLTSKWNSCPFSKQYNFAIDSGTINAESSLILANFTIWAKYII